MLNDDKVKNGINACALFSCQKPDNYVVDMKIVGRLTF